MLSAKEQQRRVGRDEERRRRRDETGHALRAAKVGTGVKVRSEEKRGQRGREG